MSFLNLIDAMPKIIYEISQKINNFLLYGYLFFSNFIKIIIIVVDVRDLNYFT